MEDATEKKFSADMLEVLSQGADEKDLVYSGLEETMVTGFHAIHETRQRLGSTCDLRTAAFVNAIDKIAAIHDKVGIYP